MTFKTKLKTLAAALCLLLASCPFPAGAHLLYKVEKPGTDKASYLLGTHHFAPVEILDSIKGLDEALNSVDKLYGEIDMAMMNNPAEMMKYSGFMMAPADSTLDKILTPAELDTVATTWNKMGKGAVPLEMMYAMKPAVISTNLMSMVMMERFPDKDFTAPGIDQIMQDRAKGLGKPVAGLEDVEFQMNLLFGYPVAEQKKDLMESVRNDGDDVVTQTLRVTDAYMARDLDAVEEIMTDPKIMPAQKADSMIYGRNASWAKILATEMGEHPLMVVVGAGHLPTEKGLIALLRQAGYTVTPVD